MRIMPSLIISVEEFFNRFPDGLILSKETGIEKSMAYYCKNYYTGYDSLGNLLRERFFDMEKLDDRLPAMERIVNIYDGPYFKVYPFSAVSDIGALNDTFKSEDVVLFFKEGALSVLDAQEIKE